MRKALPFWILALVYLVCGSRSCTDGSQTPEQRQFERIIALQDSVIRSFNKEELSEPDLRLFEHAAMQILLDWADYMRINKDTTSDHVFREQAGQMARSFFISDEWANKMEDSNFHSGSFSLDSVSADHLVLRTSDNQYIGSLNYCRVQDDPMGSGSLNTYGKLPFCAVRTEKIFGTDTLKVWSVFLGELSIKE